MDATTERQTLHLRIVLYEEGAYWVAECLELGLVSSGVDKDQVFENAKKACIGQILWAYKNDSDLDGLFRPPNSELLRRATMGKDCGLDVIFAPHEAGQPTITASCVAA